MEPEIIQSYCDVLHQIILSGDEMPPILNQLDAIQDGTDGLLASFQKHGTEMPAYWLSYLRIIKFSQNYKVRYTSHYDFYIELYDSLRELPSPNKDQSRMIQEITKVLYSMDDLSGRLDRAVTGLLQALRRGIQESHNVITESKDKILSSQVPQKAIPVLEDLYYELTAVTAEIIASAEHENSLYRIGKLMSPN